MTSELYFDHNGSTPVDPRVAEAALEQMTRHVGNPSAAHPEGLRARAALEQARARIAAGLGAEPDEIVITSGGTEANNQALLCGVSAARGRHVVVGAIEHNSVLRTAEELERRGHEVTRLPARASGAVHVRDLEAALRPDTGLVSLMFANNETGIVQPVKEVGALCRARGILLHTDAVCAFGKLPLDVRVLRCDLLSVSGHKLYAPKGVGALYVRRGLELPPLHFGCGQQEGRRSGTENVPGAVAFGRAVELLRSGELAPDEPLEGLRERLWRGLLERFPKALRNGEGASLPNTLNVAFPGRRADELQAALAERGVSVAAGAASGGKRPSHVLTAMGLGEERARSSLRFSLGVGTRAETVEDLLTVLGEVLGERRALAAAEVES